ncbi:MAG TPA: hypothetical protein VI072_23280 [Polyangiaceae bacterium]
MRGLRSNLGNGWLVAAVLAGSVVAVLPSCGGSNEASIGVGPGVDGGAGRGGQGGTLGGPGGGNGGGASGAGGGGGASSPCGASPCADHSGPKTFIVPGAPSNAPELFAGRPVREPGSNPTRQPAIVYPNHETLFPINVSRIRHEWSGAQSDLFKLVFTGPRTTVHVYTTTRNFTPSEEEWDWIAESNRGQTVRFHLEAVLTSAPTEVWRSSAIDLAFSEAAVEGAIYYWSTGTKGIMRALVSDPVPQKFYTDPAAADGNKCVACHTLSRDGKRLAVGYEGERLREVSVPERATIVPSAQDGGAPVGGPGAAQGMPAAWTTFSPDGKLLLVAANGKLTLINSDTGALVGPSSGAVSVPSGKVATHPDWSALGDKVAITLGTRGGNKEVEGGSIAILPYANGVWGTAQVLVASTGATDNNFFPTFSPDSRWIIYAHASGKSKDAVSATLRMIPVSGGAPIVLKRLNERVNNRDGTTGIGNSMPTWAPSSRAGTFWLAFSSLRAYATLRPQDNQEDQIWIAAIDPTQSDPSYSAFWAPFQSMQEGNHRAFWTRASEDTQCSCAERCGDSLDNDCDGTADEAGCVTCQEKEICGDGIDNDCDCVIDDCNVELCTDGVDNDGDGLIDMADPTCEIVE